MPTSRSLITAITCLALACGSVGALADPGKGDGQPPNSQGHGNPDNRGHQDHGNQGGPRGQDYNGAPPGGGDRARGPSINHASTLGIVGGHRDYWRPGPALPPGIQRNLERGKPIPPGIGQRLDPRLEGRLPRYEGYEWRQAGTELILVSLATGLIYEIVNGAFN